jgi:hypothetical protein
MIDVLKEMSKGKYIPFSKYTGEEDYEENVVYDDIHPNEDGTYRLPLDIVVNELHHDIISYFEDFCTPDFGYEVRVNIDEEDEDLSFIAITEHNPFKKEIDKTVIFIQNGNWQVD